MSEPLEELAIFDQLETQLREPPIYKVLLLNDDYTPMDFVILILKNIFHKSDENAEKIMMNVHKNGSAVCGIFPYAIAEAKVLAVRDLAKKHKHPLQCTLEED